MSDKHEEILNILRKANEPLTAREIANQSSSLGNPENVAKTLHFMRKKGTVVAKVTPSGRLGYLARIGGVPEAKEAAAVTGDAEAPPPAVTGDAEALPPAVTEAAEDSLPQWTVPQGKSRSVKTLAATLKQLQQEAGVREMAPESDLEEPLPMTADDSAPPTNRALRVDFEMAGDPIMRKLAEGCRAVRGALTHAKRLRALAAWEILDDEISAWLEDLAYDLERLS